MPMRTAGATSLAPKACPPTAMLLAHLEEANDHYILGIYQCLGTLLILQPCGTGPHPPPQPLSDTLGLPGTCGESLQPRPRPYPIPPRRCLPPHQCNPLGVCGSRHGRTSE